MAIGKVTAETVFSDFLMTIRSNIFSLTSALMAITANNLAAVPAKTLTNLEYAEVGGKKLLLDLYVPEGVKNPP